HRDLPSVPTRRSSDLLYTKREQLNTNKHVNRNETSTFDAGYYIIAGIGRCHRDYFGKLFGEKTVQPQNCVIGSYFSSFAIRRGFGHLFCVAIGYPSIFWRKHEKQLIPPLLFGAPVDDAYCYYLDYSRLFESKTSSRCAKSK